MRKSLLHNQQRGQAIVLIAMLMVALIAALGLAIDGGGLFLLYRDVQNATDAAGLTAAYALCTGDNYEDAALRSADLNGFVNGVDNATVLIENPPPSGTYAGDSRYIVVTITAEKPSYFIRIVYPGPLEISATTTVRCDPGDDFGFPENSALVSLRPDCGGAPGSPNESFRAGGNTTTGVIGNIFVNQNCLTTDSIKLHGNVILSADEVCTLGTIRYAGNGPAQDHIYSNDPLNPYAVIYSENPSDTDCDFDQVTSPDPLNLGVLDESALCPTTYSNLPNGTATAQPGRYTSFSNSPGDITTLAPGIYCVTGNIDIRGDLSGDGVFIYHSCSSIALSNCTININAQTDLDLAPMATGDYENLLIYSRSQNQGNPGNKFNGGADLTIAGTVYIPGGDCNFAGSNGNMITAQLICYTLNMEGDSETIIMYDPNAVYQVPANFGIIE